MLCCPNVNNTLMFSNQQGPDHIFVGVQGNKKKKNRESKNALFVVKKTQFIVENQIPGST